MAQNLANLLTLIGLITKISYKENHLWDEVTLCFSSCWIPLSVMLRSFLLRWLTLLLPVLILLKHPIMSYGAPIHGMSSKICQQLDFLGITSTHLCNFKVNGLHIKKQSAQLIPLDEELTR